MKSKILIFKQHYSQILIKKLLQHPLVRKILHNQYARKFAFFNIRAYSNLRILVKRHTIIAKMALYILLCIPIIVYTRQYILSYNKIGPGDYDYYMQLYEAFRRSVVEFHQIPWWNPWMAGGVPLLPNPQFGFFSIQLPLVLILGSVFGMKLSIVAYHIIGFFGFLKLNREILKADWVKSVAISYLWVFGSFFALHGMGHLTFFSFHYLPWITYFYYKRKENWKGWFGLGLTVSLLIGSAPHYAPIICLVLISLLWLFENIKIGYNSKNIKFQFNLSIKDIFSLSKAALVVIILCGYVMSFVYVYSGHFERSSASIKDIPISLYGAFMAVFGPIQLFGMNIPKSQWGWHEVSAYVGLGTVIVFFCILIYELVSRNRKHHKNNFNISIVYILVLMVLFFVIGLGPFSTYAPFSIIKMLPVLKGTRIATRWLIVVSFLMLIVIASFKKKSYLINLLLVLSIFECFYINYPFTDMIFKSSISKENTTQPFQQYYKYTEKLNGGEPTLVQYYESLYPSTRNNYGQVIAADSLIDTRTMPTMRCGINQDDDCQFVMSKNAIVKYWSPNKIVLERTDIGLIELNMNPSKFITVNGIRIFNHLRETEPNERFLIYDVGPTITVKVEPKFSPGWLMTKIKS